MADLLKPTTLAIALSLAAAVILTATTGPTFAESGGSGPGGTADSDSDGGNHSADRFRPGRSLTSEDLAVVAETVKPEIQAAIEAIEEAIRVIQHNDTMIQLAQKYPVHNRDINISAARRTIRNAGRALHAATVELRFWRAIAGESQVGTISDTIGIAGSIAQGLRDDD